jgi:hypothetical protein
MATSSVVLATSIATLQLATSIAALHGDIHTSIAALAISLQHSQRIV